MSIESAVYLGLDLGTQTGWAVMRRDGDLLASGSAALSLKSFEGAGIRYIRFFALLRRLHSEHGPFRLVGYEEVRRHQGTTAAHVYGGLLAMLGSWCEKENTPYTGFSVGQIKQHATGKGNAGKAAMVDAAQQRHGIEVADDNEADAIHIADMARQHEDQYAEGVVHAEE